MRPCIRRTFLTGLAAAAFAPTAAKAQGGFMLNQADLRNFIAGGLQANASAAAINTMIQALAAVGGGYGYIPPWAIGCTETIDIKYDRVELCGAGASGWTDGGSGYTVGTHLYALFDTDNLVKIRSERGVNSAKRRGLGLRNMMLNGNQLSPGVLLVDSINQSRIDGVYVTGSVGTQAVHVTSAKSFDGAVGLSENADTQDCYINIFVRQIDTEAEQQVHCVTLDGSENANVSVNRGPGRGLNFTVQHKNGHALYIPSADTNEIWVRATRISGGTGKTVHGGGRRAAKPTGCEYNEIDYSGAGAVYAEGTNDSGVTAGVLNYYKRDVANGAPTPTQGTGSSWTSLQ